MTRPHHCQVINWPMATATQIIRLTTTGQWWWSLKLSDWPVVGTQIMSWSKTVCEQRMLESYTRSIWARLSWSWILSLRKMAGSKHCIFSWSTGSSLKKIEPSRLMFYGLSLSEKLSSASSASISFIERNGSPQTSSRKCSVLYPLIDIFTVRLQFLI